jgi:hypothetical protein
MLMLSMGHGAGTDWSYGNFDQKVTKPRSFWPIQPSDLMLLRHGPLEKTVRAIALVGG